MPISQKEILEAMSEMSEIELNELVKALENHGVTAAVAVAAPVAANPPPDQSALLAGAPGEIVTLAEDNEEDSVP